MDKDKRVWVGYQKIVKQNKVYILNKEDNVLKLKTEHCQSTKKLIQKKRGATGLFQTVAPEAEAGEETQTWHNVTCQK